MTCSWCLRSPASTTLYASPTCTDCAATDRKTRVNRWLRAAREKLQ